MQLLSTSDAAKRLRISRQRMLVLAREGRVPGAQRLKGYWIFTLPLTVLPPKPRPS